MLDKRLLAIGAVMAAFSVQAYGQGGQVAASAAATDDMKGFAGSSFQVPVAFGAEWGSFGAGVYGETLQGDNDVDGSAAVAFGLGNADDSVALEVAVATSSLTGANSPDTFGESGSLGFKLHTNLGGYASYAVGVNGTGRWGSRGFKDSNRASVYTVVSKMVPVGPFAAVLNFGIGDQLYNEPGKDNVGIIGSGALYLTNWLSVIGEYTGRFANAAVSVAPFPTYFPVTLTLGAVNLGKRYDADTEFAASLGAAFAF